MLKKLNSMEEINKEILQNDMVLIYFGSNDCGVCVDMKPKVMEFLKAYPKINSIYVDVQESIKLSSGFNIFTIPGILLFIEGKETLREARHLSIIDLEQKIARYYNLLFE